MSKRRLIWLLVLIALAAAIGWYRLGAREAPPGQPPLATLDESSIAALRSDFNRDADKVRILVLLSPT